MIPADSARPPTVSLSARWQPWGRLLALLIDMLAVGCSALFYDGLVVAIVFWIDAVHNSKSSTYYSETTTTGLVLGAGLVVGSMAVIGLLLSKMYLRALAVVLGLLPLALVTQLVCDML